jgi:membrane-associated protein
VDLIHQILHFVLHIDQVLPDLLARYGSGIYAILFVIIFCETGLVVAPILPGDSLLFVAGAMAAAGGLNPLLIVALLMTAAVCGDTVNYHVGKWCRGRLDGPRAQRLIKPAYLERTREFFDRHGGKAIILARFTPVVRTYAPFVAGLGAMRFRRFIGFCVAGAAAWVGGITAAGWFFGRITWVREHLSMVILGIVIASVMPMVIVAMREKRRAAKG